MKKAPKQAKGANSAPTADASSVLDRAKKTVASLEEAFDTVRQQRGVTSGAPTDEEQDLLRAALVFAAAGLDSALKPIFDARNQIIHELDIDLTRSNRGRRSRQKAKVLEDANRLISIGEALVSEVTERLGGA